MPDQSSQRERSRTALRRLRELVVRPHRSWVHALIVVLCLALGFGIVVQVRQTQDSSFESLRQDDLVRLLDELTQRNAELETEASELTEQLRDLESGSTSATAARETAEQQSRVQGILAGTVPVTGPGIELVVDDPDHLVTAPTFVTVLEELRNAGTEAVELNGQRLSTSSWILTGHEGLVVSGTEVSPPYRWRAIGDPQTMAVALEIPGGALAAIRAAGASAELQQRDRVEITAVRSLAEPRFATPVPADGAS